MKLGEGKTPLGGSRLTPEGGPLQKRHGRFSEGKGAVNPQKKSHFKMQFPTQTQLENLENDGIFLRSKKRPKTSPKGGGVAPSRREGRPSSARKIFL